MEKCYVLICNCYTGDNGVSVFYNYDDAKREMIKELEVEVSDLAEEKYMYKKELGDIEAHLYVPDSDIYYDWVIVKTNIR